MDVEQIKKILPHRYPFLLVDKVLEKSSISDEEPRVGQWARCVKNVSINEPFFQGHFPQKAVMPGVLMIEAMAQAGALAMYRPGDKRADVLLASVKEARFRRPVVPGDQLFLEAKILKHRSHSVLIGAEAKVCNNLVAESHLLVHVV